MYMFIFIGIAFILLVMRYIQISLTNYFTFEPSPIPLNGLEDVNYKFNGNVILDSFTGKSGKKIWYLFYCKSKTPSWDDKITFFCHGNGGNIITNSQYNFTDKLSETSSVFVFDYRGYGLSPGCPSEHGVYEDTKDAWDFVIKKHPDVNTIIPIGHSLGSSILSHLMKEESKNNNKIPPVIILSAPFYNGKIIAVEMMPYLGYFNSNLFNTHDYLSSIKKKSPSCKIIYIHSEQDEVIGYHHSKMLQNNIGGTMFLTSGKHDNPFLNKNIEDLFYLITN